MFDRLMQGGQIVIGHHGEHMMFDMVIHVPIDETADRVHVNATGIEAVIKHVIGHAGVLQ